MMVLLAPVSHQEQLACAPVGMPVPSQGLDDLGIGPLGAMQRRPTQSSRPASLPPEPPEPLVPRHPIVNASSSASSTNRIRSRIFVVSGRRPVFFRRASGSIEP
jgi:hypothetical protein